MNLLQWFRSSMTRRITGAKKRAADPDQAHQALRESEEKYRALIESTSDWIWEIDSNGIYTYASPKVRDLLGYAPEEVLGKTPFDLMTPEDAVRLRPQVASIIGGRMPFQRLENANLHKDGRIVILETSGVPIFDENRQWTGYRGIDRDITERKSTEYALEELNRTLQQRIEAEVGRSIEKDRMIMIQARQAAMGEMLGNVAHQWRQPLNAIGLIIQDLQDAQANGLLTPEYLQQSIQRGMEVIKHMSQTIDDFRSLYRTDKEKQPFSVNRVLDKILAFVQASFRHHQITIDAQGGEPVSVEGYPNEFAQVLLNLLINARDVLVERAVSNPRVTIRLGRDGDRVTVIIADNGGGISDSILDRIFEPYFTTKEEGRGTGIGLYMSKTIIEKNMGGTLSARNVADGAEFRITL